MDKQIQRSLKEIYEDDLRLAHSIREGTVSASFIMGKLGSYSRQNRLATALREKEPFLFRYNFILKMTTHITIKVHKSTQLNI